MDKDEPSSVPESETVVAKTDCLDVVTVVSEELPVEGLPTPTIPGFDIVNTLGKGGMGLVYLGHQTDSLNRDVAIKTILDSYTHHTYFRRKFLEEGARHAQLHHPHILPIFQAGEVEQCLYLVMHFARDGSLRDLINKGPLAVADAARIITQIAEALVHAHHELEEPIIHLDIKPENILFDGKNPLLSDFGIARDLSGEDAPGSVVAGDPRYWAPEQQNNKPSGKSDIYALGLTFFEMLVGRPPKAYCKIVSDSKDREAILKALPADARVYSPLIADCLRAEPTDRPTATELVTELRKLSRPRLNLGRLTAASALALVAVYFIASPTAQQHASDSWRQLFPLPEHEVNFALMPRDARLWIDDREQALRSASLTETGHHVVVVAKGHLGQHQLAQVNETSRNWNFSLQARPPTTDAEFMAFSRDYGVNDDIILAHQWNDATLGNLVNIERMNADSDPQLAKFMEELQWLARAGDAVAQTTLYYAAFEGLPVPGESATYLSGLNAASGEGYALASLLNALHIVQELLDSGQTFDRNPEAFDTATALLRLAKEQGMPRTAATFARIISADLSL